MGEGWGILPGLINMGATAAIMGISAISSIGTGISQSRALSAKGAVDQSIAQTNAKISELQSSQELDAGNEAASKQNLKTHQIVGAVRAQQSGSGLAVGTGSNALQTSEIENSGAMDEITIRNNAARKAWGYKVQALNDTFQGKMARMTANNASEQTLLTGGIGAISGPLSIYASAKQRELYASGKRAPSQPFDGEF